MINWKVDLGKCMVKHLSKAISAHVPPSLAAGGTQHSKASRRLTDSTTSKLNTHGILAMMISKSVRQVPCTRSMEGLC